MSNYNLTNTANPILQNINPNSTKLTLEQQYNQIAQQLMNTNPSQTQANQANPYNDYVAVLNSCTDITKQKIVEHPRYQQSYGQCETLLKQYLYAQCIPYVLQDQNGRIAFEQLLNVTKGLKEEVIQDELQKERRLAEKEKELDERSRQIEMLLQNENIQKLLASGDIPTNIATNVQSKVGVDK